MYYDEYRAKLIIAVMGECESCSYFEKVLVAIVGWNRYYAKNIKFNPLEVDFAGYNREIIINDVSREKFEDSVRAVDEAQILINMPKYQNIFFFNLHGNKPSTLYPVEEVKFRDDCKHHFFKIIEEA